jgi:hypothetical protein
MKTRIVIGVFCALLLLTMVAGAQGFYFKAGGGYNFGLPKMKMGVNETYIYKSTSSTSYTTYTDENVYGTLIKGLGFDGALGIKGETFGIEVGVSYIPTSKFEYSNNYSAISTSTSSLSADTYNYESSLLTISPCFVISTGSVFYGRAGAVIGFPKTKYTEAYQSGTYTAEKTFEYSENIAFGFTGAFGLAFGGESFKFFVEANFNSLTWAPKRGEITAYKVNGVDQLSTLTTSQRVTVYDDSYTYDSRVTTSTDKETQALKTYMPFSSLGLKAGITIGF